jgi:SagB-type dehydrogenase family enzyme
VSSARSKRVPASRTSKAGGELYRRTPSMVAYWRGGQFVLDNFLTQRRISADPLAAAILHFFDRYRMLRDLFAHFPEYAPASLRKAVRSLVRHSFLQTPKRGALHEKELAAWGEWNPAASFFHFSTKDLKFETDAAKEFREVVELAQSKPMPQPVKPYAKARRVRLPEPTAGGEFARVLLTRRTWRKFSPKPVTLEALNKALALTWGVQNFVSVPKLVRIAVKTSPSGGALHPIEAYVLVRNVERLSAGLYHYNGADHCLELLRRGANSKEITRWLAHQWWYGGAAFVVFMTAVFGRTQWKYDYARAYRAMLLEAGHLCQTFCLTATWLNLAPFCTLAFADSVIEKAIGIDGVSESVVYVVGAGARPENERQAHLLSGSEVTSLRL